MGKLESKTLVGEIAPTEAIINHSVIDAVAANFKSGRTYSEHWNYYMNAEQRKSFSDNCAAFLQACRARRTWLTT